MTNSACYPIIATVYHYSYEQWLNTDLNTAVSLLRNWISCAGINSGSMVFSESIKLLTGSLYPKTEVKDHTPGWIKEKLKLAELTTGQAEIKI